MSEIAFILRRYPHLEKYLPMTCLCGQPVAPAKAFTNKRFAGLISESCACGAPPVTLSAHTSKADNDKSAKALRALLGDIP